MPTLHPYFGGKNFMSKWIYSYIPKDIKIYCEVFSGSMSVYFNEDFSKCDKIIYNDANKLQMNFIACCKDYDRMIIEIEKSFKSGFLQYSENNDVKDIKTHYRNLYTDTKNGTKCDFYDNLNFNIPDYGKGVIYAFMITSSFNACHARGSGFAGISKNGKLKINTLINKLRKEEYHKKLNKIDIIENLDFEKLFSKYDTCDSYFYCDPPYKHTNGVGTHDKDYGSKDIFGDDSHERLAKILQNTKSRWSLSYYWFEELEKWFPKDRYVWKSKEFNRSSASFSNKERGKEILIMNYDPLNGYKID